MLYPMDRNGTYVPVCGNYDKRIKVFGDKSDMTAIALNTRKCDAVTVFGIFDHMA